jgi:hypothetical protein
MIKEVFLPILSFLTSAFIIAVGAYHHRCKIRNFKVNVKFFALVAKKMMRLHENLFTANNFFLYRPRTLLKLALLRIARGHQVQSVPGIT